MKRKVRIKLKAKCNSKLAFVKIIKEYTNWGLKDSKFFADRLFDDFENNRNRFCELELVNPQNFNSFLSDLKDMGVDAFITGGIQWDRDFKMLSLGIGDKEDYISFISEFIKNIPYDENSILDMVLSKLDQDDLNDIINEIKKEYDSNL